MSVVRKLLFIECSFCKVWIIAGKGAAAEARMAHELIAAAMGSGWSVADPITCPACIKEARR